MMIEAVYEWINKINIGEYSKKIYLNQVNLFFKWFGKVTPVNIEDFLLEGTGKKRVYIRKSAIKSFLLYLDNKNIINFKDDYSEVFKNIKYKIKDRKELQTLRYEKVVYLINKLNDEELKLILMIAFDTGARIRSILKIRKSDILSLSDSTEIYLREKGEKNVSKTITQETDKHLQKFIVDREKYIFLNRKKIKMSYIEDKYYELWTKLKNKSRKILKMGKGVSFHWIRRGAGIYWYEKTGYDLRAVQEFLGHTDPKTTAKYLKLSGERIRKEFKNETRKW